jgi:hypothetical protein
LLQESYLLELAEPAATWEKAYRLTCRVLLESGLACPIHPGIATQMARPSASRKVQRLRVSIGGSVTTLELDQVKLKRQHAHTIVAAVLVMVSGENSKTLLQRTYPSQPCPRYPRTMFQFQASQTFKALCRDLMSSVGSEELRVHWIWFL